MFTQTYIYYINNMVPFDFFSHPSCYFAGFFFSIFPLRSLLPWYFPLYDSSLLHFTFLDQERQTSLERTSLQNYMIQPDHSPQLTFHAPYTPALLVYLF